MRFNSLLAVLALGVCAAEKPLFAPTGYFTPECLTSFPREEFRGDVETALDRARKSAPDRAALCAGLKAAGSPRFSAVKKRMEILDSLVRYMSDRLAAGTSESLLFAWSAHDELNRLTVYFQAEQKLFQERKSASAWKTFSVRDFGAKGDGRTDDGPAVRRAVDAAIDAAIASASFARVVFPSGTYRIVPETVYPANVSWKNRQSGKRSSWEAETLKKAHLRLLSPEHLTLEGEGNGAKLLFTDPALCGIRILGGYDTVLRNLTLDYENLPFTQGRILAVNPQKTLAEVEIDDGFPLPTAPNLLHAPSRRITPVSPETKTYLPGTFPLGKVEPLGGRRFRFAVGAFHPDASRADLKPGNPAVITGRYDSKKANAVNSVCSKFDFFENVVIHSSPSWTYLLISEAPILLGCRVEAPEGSSRLASTNGDGLMFSSNGRVGPYLENCTFSSMEDDGINLAASSTALNSVSADGLRCFPEWTMNDTPGVMILDGCTGKVKAVRKVSVKNGKPEFVPALPAGIATRESLRQQALTEDQKREKRTMYRKEPVVRPDVIVTLGGTFGGSAVVNCTYRNIRGLGVQLTAPSVLVENCTFDTLTGPGVSLTALSSWGLYHSTHNSVVRNCRFRNTGGPAVYVRYIPPYSNGTMEPRSLNGIRIENNDLESSRNPALSLWNCSDVRVSGNRIRALDPNRSAVLLNNFCDTVLENNTFLVPSGSAPVRFADPSERGKLKDVNNKTVHHE